MISKDVDVLSTRSAVTGHAPGRGWRLCRPPGAPGKAGRHKKAENMTKTILAYLLIALWAVPAQGADLVDAVQKKYESLSGFKAEFTQDLKNSASGEGESRSGTIAFKKPSLVRWETVKPEKELLVVGKDAVWDYFEDDREAYRYPVEEVINSKTMLKFLTGKANLREDFHVFEEADAEAAGLVRFKLVPKEPEPGLVMASVWVDPGTQMIMRLSIQDFYANTNDLSLKNLTVEAGLPDSLFSFTPPPGVAVHDNTGADGRNLSK
ncbi:outer membrane lipoprotein carrier protein lola [hydrocarbon metagenome]|uniref:Outer membrane lipoprotein carrier protein lola n=1 Tax=hydrocarbon metagenome TaxID=938273 RepID=A0A0W8G3P8_9ZZZZ